jgi:hypothetical protein
MHLLAATTTNLDEIVEAVDLGQPPGDIAVLSFADSDLTGLAAAWDAERSELPSVRRRACGSRICATCVTRCRSIFGSTASERAPR